MIALWLGLASFAWALDPATEPERPEGIPSDAVEVHRAADPGSEATTDDAYSGIIVVTDKDIRAARNDVIRAAEAKGWRAKRKNGFTVFRPPEVWMGRLKFYDNGYLEFTHNVVNFSGGEGHATQPYDPALASRTDHTGGTGPTFGFAPSRSKTEPVQRELREAIQDSVQKYNELLRSQGLSDAVSDLPRRLDDVWERGIPLQGTTSSTLFSSGRPTPSEPTLRSWEARRADVLSYWATRTSTPEGRLFCRTIEQWLRAVVMNSEHPVTPEEAEAAQARRDDGRILDIFPGEAIELP